MAVSFLPLVGALVFDGVIAAVLAVSVLGIGYILAVRGAAAVVRFLYSVVGFEPVEWVKVGNLGYWDKDVYESAMRDLNRHKRAGGIMDKESRDELASWQLANPDEMRRSRH